MASIEEFINRRYIDAKEEVRRLDGDFVNEFESAVRLNNIGLEPPRLVDTLRKPRQRLSKGWHRTLEACVELTMRASILECAAIGLHSNSHKGKSRNEVGRFYYYHFRSWFMHSTALSETTGELIRSATDLYVADPDERKKIKSRHAGQLHELFSRFSGPRNRYTHFNRECWPKGLTEDDLWEGHVAVGMTSQRFLEEFFFPSGGANLLSGKCDGVLSETESLLDRIGAILDALEKAWSRKCLR